MKKNFCIIFFAFVCYQLQAQESFVVKRSINFIEQFGEYNNNYQKWGKVDGVNSRYMPRERELTRYLLRWASEGKLQTYEAQGILDFSKKIPQSAIQSKLVYFDSKFKDSIELRPTDLYIMDIEEKVKEENGTLKYNIEALVLTIPKGVNEDSKEKNKPLMRFRYADVQKICNETYQHSKNLKMWNSLECFYQLYEDNTQTVSLAEALDKRYFKAKILEVIPADKKTLLAKEKKYEPQASPKPDTLLYVPKFMEVGKNTIRANLYERIDLRQNEGFYHDQSIFIEGIRKGIQNKELTPYVYQAYSFWKADTAKSYKIEELFAYFDSSLSDSVIVRAEDLYLMELRSIVEIKKGKSIQYIPYAIALILPADRISDVKWDNKICMLSYAELKAYFRKKEKIFPNFLFKNKGKQMSFDKAIEKRLFNSSLYKFSNIPHASIARIAKSWYEEGYWASEEEFEKYVENQGKMVIKYLEDLAK